MPILTHVHEASTQADGSSSNVLRLYDQDGHEYTQVFFSPAGANVQSKIDSAIVKMDEQLKQSEFEQIVGL
jgi:hypothetical protein